MSRRKTALDMLNQYGSDAWSQGGGMADTYPEISFEEFDEMVKSPRGLKIPRQTGGRVTWARLPTKFISDFLEGVMWWRK